MKANSQPGFYSTFAPSKLLLTHIKQMKNNKSIFYILSLAILVLVFSVGESFGQPSDAQIKKAISGPKTVSVTLGSPGTVEWSSTYKKYVWSRNFTAKVKTDEPGVFVTVKGYASYDVMGGRYVFWRTFTSANSYTGKKNPTVSEINDALESASLREFDPANSIIGEFESLKISADPMWEWHTPNSVSFNAVAVFTAIYRGGSYSGEPIHNHPSGMTTVDKIESILRIRLYRIDEKTPWDRVGVKRPQMSRVKNSTRESIYLEKLLERKDYPNAEVQRMARMSKVPLLKQ